MRTGAQTPSTKKQRDSPDEQALNGQDRMTKQRGFGITDYSI
jgi:hypothetical protein